MRVLGLSFSAHGAAACLVEDGAIACAVNLERLTRVKFSIVALPSFRRHVEAHVRATPTDEAPPLFDVFEVFPKMLGYVTGERDLKAAGIDLLVRVSDTLDAAAGAPDYEALMAEFSRVPTHFTLEHHLCHAYQAYLSSPFEEAAILTVDGAGERLDRLGGGTISATLGMGRAGRVDVLHEVPATSSLGGLFHAATRHLGFGTDQEGNTMALAAFGTDRFRREIEDSFRFEPTGAFHMVRRAGEGAPIWLERMLAFCPPRRREDPIEARHQDLAHGVQAMTEESLLHAARRLHARTGTRRLAMAGGVALNCVANTRILRETPFEELYVMPNAGDRGLAAGAALYGAHVLLGATERRPPRHDFLGRPLGDAEILSDLRAAHGVEYRRAGDVADVCAQLLSRGFILGFVQGGAEFGPRALGHRSLLADPTAAGSKARLDAEIKQREWFRPYAPSVLAERADEYFEMDGPSPFMARAVPVRAEMRERLIGITHVDGSARVHTVSREIDPRFHRLIERFASHGGVPVVLNTSLNGPGEPIVETAADAVAALQRLRFDALAVGDWLVWRAEDRERLGSFVHSG